MKKLSCLLSSIVCVVALGGCGGDDAGRLQPDAGTVFFDPLAASSLAKVFETASAAIAADFPQHALSFVQLVGLPHGSAQTYEQTPFLWNYTLAARDTSSCKGATKGVEVAWPGWTAVVMDEMPMGAYVAESEIGVAIPLSLEPLLKAIADDGVNPGACPITADGRPPGGILLRGTVWWPAGVHWFWNIWCDGHPEQQFFFDVYGSRNYPSNPDSTGSSASTIGIPRGDGPRSTVDSLPDLGSGGL